MISIRISDPSIRKIRQIAEDLLTHQMIIEAHIATDVECLTLENGRVVNSTITVMTAKTRAALFQTIFDRVHQVWVTNPPDISSVPIVNMDWQQADVLIEPLKSA